MADTFAGDACPTTVLILVAHGGSVLDLDMEPSVRKSDVTTFRGAMESVLRTHYPNLVGHVVVKCVPCPGICTEALAVLSNLSPYSFDVTPIGMSEPSSKAARELHQEFFFGVSNDHLPVSAIPIFALSSSTEYSIALNEFTNTANKVMVISHALCLITFGVRKVVSTLSGDQVFNDFVTSEEGHNFMGQVVLVGDSVGAMLCYDALCNQGEEHLANKRTSSDGSINNQECSEQSHFESRECIGATFVFKLTRPNLYMLCSSVASFCSSIVESRKERQPGPDNRKRRLRRDGSPRLRVRGLRFLRLRESVRPGTCSQENPTGVKYD